MLSAIAATRYGLRHTGKRRRLSFSDNEFMALNISIVTRIEREIVVARCASSFVNIWQPISGKAVAHLWKFVCCAIAKKGMTCQQRVEGNAKEKRRE